MSTSPLQTSNTEPLLMDLLFNNDVSMEEMMAQFTNENTDAVDPFALPSTLPQDNRNQRLFVTPPVSPQANAGAQEQGYVSSPEVPSLTTDAWTPVNGTGTSQYETNPTAFGGLIDPNLDAPADLPSLVAPADLFNFDPMISAPLIQPEPQSWISSIPDSSSSSGSLYTETRIRKRKAGPSTTSAPTKRTKHNLNSRAPKPAPLNPILSAPLSILTFNSPIPLRDMHEQINRPASTRQGEAKYKRSSTKQAVPRPMNSFMLYRAAYTPRIQAMGKRNGNHQVVSAVAGESWRMETEECRAEFAGLAELDERMHEKAFPAYKYQPAKGWERGKRAED